MKKRVFICGIAALMIGMVSCKSAQKDVKVNDSLSVEAGDNSGNVLDENLVEKYWRLTELFGEPVNTPEGGGGAHIIFKKEDNRITGNGGCNTFNGSFTLKPGNRISFSKTISTMMMCANMDTESKLYQVLEMADNYTVSGDKLVLNKARMAPLARFEVVYMN
jgi:Heat shock protein